MEKFYDVSLMTFSVT